MTKHKSETEVFKIDLDIENCGGLGVKTTNKGANKGENLHQTKFVQNSTKSTENKTSKTERMRINLNVENIGGLGIKRTKREGKKGQNLQKN